MKRSLTPPPAVEADPYSAEGAVMLPTSLAAAVKALDDDGFYRTAFGDTLIDYLLLMKRAEIARYEAALSAAGLTDSPDEVSGTGRCASTSSSSRSAGRCRGAGLPPEADREDHRRRVRRVVVDGLVGRQQAGGRGERLAALGLDAGHALAGLHRRRLVFIQRTLGYDPVRVDGEVDHQFRAERLDQFHFADELRAGNLRARRAQVLGARR